MSDATYLFTSESVNEGHPGKRLHCLHAETCLMKVLFQTRSAIRCPMLCLMPAFVKTRLPVLRAVSVAAVFGGC